MKRDQPRKEAPPRDRAWEAMGLLWWSIKWDKIYGQAEDDDTIRHGLDAMASALVDWRGEDVEDALSLDEILAALKVDDDTVEATAQLIDLLGRAGYDGSLSYDDVREAEGLRERLVEALDALLNRLEKEDAEATNDAPDA